MEGEACFKFKCGSALQAATVADWLECEGWPDDLRQKMESSFGSFEDIASLVLQADAEKRNVLIQARDGSSLDAMVEVLNYAMQKWRSVPSPQGFTFGRARKPKVDPKTYENFDFGEYDGGAVLLRRGAEPEIITGASWLEYKMRGEANIGSALA